MLPLLCATLMLCANQIKPELKPTPRQAARTEARKSIYGHLRPTYGKAPTIIRIYSPYGLRVRKFLRNIRILPRPSRDAITTESRVIVSAVSVTRPQTVDKIYVVDGIRGSVCENMCDCKIRNFGHDALLQRKRYAGNGGV
jgi:hypothetical protein